jgi:hypothetical protein
MVKKEHIYQAILQGGAGGGNRLVPNGPAGVGPESAIF